MILYSTKSCIYCPAAKQWLKDHNIDFEEIILDGNPEEIKKLVALTGKTSVPVLVLPDDSYMVGFNAKDWERNLL